MKKKFPVALLIAALLIAIPGLWAALSGSSAAEPLTLTPGQADTGLKSTADRVAFWEQRIAGPADHLNRVQAGVALLELARQTADSNTYRAALTMADKALEANPTSLDARILRGAALSSDHQFEAALAEAKRALQQDQNSFQAHAVAADALLELGLYDESWSHLQVLVAQKPEAPAVLARLAEFAWDTDEPEQALEHGKQALARANEAGLSRGELSFYVIRLARFKLDTGDVSGAEELAVAAVTLAPHAPAVHSTMGSVHWAKGDLDEAVTSYERAVSIAPLNEAIEALAELESITG